jgi:hypothetical protein
LNDGVPQGRRDAWQRGRGGDVSTRAEVLDQAAQALDIGSVADRIALGVVHSQHDGGCTKSIASLTW